MDFRLDPEEEAFRDEVRAFLDEQLPPPEARDGAFMAEWNRLVRERRWVGFSWPREVGGGGAGLMQQAILKEEMARRQAPPLGTCFMGLAWVGPSIIQYGTEEQKQRFVPDILDGAYQWCTGYSEPGSGSDLASLQCRAVRDGDHYVVDGQKIWTTFAKWAKWMILLVRTRQPSEARKGKAAERPRSEAQPSEARKNQSKHAGITCLLVEMATPGIDVRPIRNMAGGEIFAEVFFDGVRVPVENRLGEEGQGWEVTVSALANERSGIAEVQTLLRTLDGLRELAARVPRQGRPAREDPVLRRRLARAQTRIEALRLNGLRFLTRQLRGEPLGPETSINKLLRAELDIELGELALEIQGSRGALAGEDAEEGGRWQRYALSWPEVVIGGGTPNIQRNIIAERILGLPKD